MRWALWGRLKKPPIQAGSDVLLRCVTFTERLKSPSYDAHQHRYSWIRHEDRRRQVVYVQSKSSGHTWNINILNIIKCFHVSVYNKCLPFSPDPPDLRPLIEQISEGECSRHRAGCWFHFNVAYEKNSKIWLMPSTSLLFFYLEHISCFRFNDGEMYSNSPANSRTTTTSDLPVAATAGITFQTASQNVLKTVYWNVQSQAFDCTEIEPFIRWS